MDKKLVVFESDPDFSDNSRGLWEYIVNETDYKTFWIIKDEKMVQSLREKGVSCDIEGSELANEMVSKARFLVSTSFAFAGQKNSKQIHVSVWHGMPLKLVGFFESAAQNSQSLEDLKIITTQNDIITVTSRLSQLTLSGMFAMDPRKVKETGFPRNDIMLNIDGKEELKKITNVDLENSKLIFYLPTMRKGLKDEGDQFEKNIFNYVDYDPDTIDDFLEKHNAYIFSKMHFADNSFFSDESFKLPKRMIFLNTDILNKHFLTIYHVMNAFDVLITDYSSVYVDYLLLDKPIIFSCSDLDKFKQDRGFIVDDPTLLMPGAIVKRQEELLYNLNNIFSGIDEFRADRKNKMSFFHLYIDAHSSERVFNEMLKAERNVEKNMSEKRGNIWSTNNWSLLLQEKNVRAEIFFDIGDGFCEKLKVVRDYSIEDEDRWICFEEDIPLGTCNIRFDPDTNGRCVLKKLSIWLDNDPVKYKIVKGSMYGDYVIFEDEDPQIIISLEGKNYKKIKIEYQGKDLYSNAGKIIGFFSKKQEEQLNELSRIYSSHFWKLSKVFRNIKSIVKKYICR